MNRTLGSKAEQEARRLAAGRLLLAGKRNAEVVRTMNVSPSSVRRWKHVVHREGLDGLRAKPLPGRPPRLSKRQRERLTRIVLRGAMAAGFSSDLWTGKRLAQVIRQAFGVEHHPNHVLRILRQLDFTPQKPLRRARQQDHEAMERWLAVEWPRIKRGRLAGAGI
ncbi:MAG: transposase [Pirellulales bacterium]|nr:transposase [Pirellulales bacterium]